MKSEKLTEVRPIIERNALVQTNSQVKKFIDFFEIHDLVADSVEWKYNAFTEVLIDRY